MGWEAGRGGGVQGRAHRGQSERPSRRPRGLGWGAAREGGLGERTGGLGERTGGGGVRSGGGAPEGRESRGCRGVVEEGEGRRGLGGGGKPR